MTTPKNSFLPACSQQIAVCVAPLPWDPWDQISVLGTLMKR